MIVILNSGIDQSSDIYRKTLQYLEQLPNIQVRTHEIQGEEQKLTELYLLGDTHKLEGDD